jgi:uncharacterized protein
MTSHNRFISPAVILGVSIIISVFIFGINWKSVKKENQTITVTGSAKKDITSDLGILKVMINGAASSSKDAYNRIEFQKPELVNYFKSKGISDKAIEFQTFSVYPQYEYNSYGAQGRLIGYNANQMLQVQSADVELIKSISLDIPSLLQKGLDFQVMPPEYYYTKLADVKIDIQAEAAKDAKMRAEKIAAATNSELGVMRNARMGVLQITPQNSNMVSDYGMNDVSSIDKEITAVVNASFEIK